MSAFASAFLTPFNISRFVLVSYTHCDTTPCTFTSVSNLRNQSGEKDTNGSGYEGAQDSPFLAARVGWVARAGQRRAGLDNGSSLQPCY
jgi:hypothetical protein